MELQSEAIDLIAAAMVKVQGAMGPAYKGSTNPFYGKKYADLVADWDSCRQPLQDNDIAVIQGAHPIEGKSYLITTLAHGKSGQWIRGVFPLHPVTTTTTYEKNGKQITIVGEDVQETGIVIKYLRRYSLESMLGIVTADDDGEGAMRRDTADPRTMPAPKEEVFPKNFSRETKFWLEIKGYEKSKGQPFSELPDSLLEFMVENKDAPGLTASKKKAAEFADEELGIRIDENNKA